MRTIPFLFTTKLRDVNAHYFLHTHTPQAMWQRRHPRKGSFNVLETEPKQFVSAVRLTFDLYKKILAWLICLSDQL